jgi:hypothetical protein
VALDKSFPGSNLRKMTSVKTSSNKNLRKNTASLHNLRDANSKAAQVLLDHIKPKTTGGHEIDKYRNDIVPDVTEKQNAEEPFHDASSRKPVEVKRDRPQGQKLCRLGGNFSVT